MGFLDKTIGFDDGKYYANWNISRAIHGSDLIIAVIIIIIIVYYAREM